MICYPNCKTDLNGFCVKCTSSLTSMTTPEFLQKSEICKSCSCVKDWHLMSCPLRSNIEIDDHESQEEAFIPLRDEV
jgi:hypothetical protein